VYRNPKPCAGVLVVDGEELLLIERTNPPNVGAWSLPAGFLEHDEPPKRGAVRELEEETGVHVAQEDIELFDTAFVPMEGRANVLVLVYRVERGATEGEPTPGSDAADARFWDVEDVSGELEPGYEGMFRRAVGGSEE
jgi:ADP-ribose pyrophosphatase YjhB (NUDIX family)